MELMLGNEAVAQGAWEAGVAVVCSYPGTPSTEITEAVIREEADGLLVYYDIPDGEPGYSIIDFPCSAPGEIVRVEAVMEGDDGESRASASGTVECPTK